MTVYTPSPWPGTIRPALSWEAIVSTFRVETRVMIAGIVGVVAVVLAMLGAVVVLVLNDGETATLLALVNTLVSTFAAITASQAKAAAKQAVEQTNGTNSKLVDAVIASPAPGGS